MGRIEFANPEVIELLRHVSPIPVDQHNMAIRYQCLSQSLQEVHQLYRLYDWNRQVFFNNIILTANDAVSYKNESLQMTDDILFDVNGCIGNILSAGRNLVDSFEATLKTECGPDSQYYQRYKECASNEYDSNAGYFLLYELRNFVQHGHLIVSLAKDPEGIRARLDPYQLLSPSRLDVKEKVRAYLQQAIDRIEGLGDRPFLSLGFYLEPYNVAVLELYCQFLKQLSPEVSTVSHEFHAYLKAHQQMVGHFPDGSSFAFYEKEDTQHILNGIDQRLSNIHKHRIKAVTKSLTAARKELTDMNKGIRYLS